MPEQEHRTEKDSPLRRDIRTLGDALGRAIQQHSGTTVFETEERLRRSCKRLRECVEALAHSSESEALGRGQLCAVPGRKAEVDCRGD